MTSPVTLVRLHPDSRALAQWAVRHRYVGRTGGHDLGYALHAALLHVFGGRAPRPFAYREPDARSESRLPELLGYCEGDSDTICANALRIASDDTASVLRPQSLTARTLPASWPADHRLAFELRVRPVVRARPHGRSGPSHELDAAAWACVRAQRLGTPVPTKEDAYRDWLRSRLAARGCELRHARPVHIRRTRVLRRPADQGNRRPVMIEGPDVLFRGELKIRDPQAFAAVFRQGVGRHAAFGFGCLLLAPANTYA